MGSLILRISDKLSKTDIASTINFRFGLVQDKGSLALHHLSGGSTGPGNKRCNDWMKLVLSSNSAVARLLLGPGR